MRQKRNMLKLTIAIAFVALAAIASADSNYCGDANGDKIVNISDAVYMISYIFGGGPAPDPNCCESDCPPTMTDDDGNTYFTVKIGDQCWMAQNLKATHYRNGDPIPNVTDAGTWAGLSTGAYCDYVNDPAFVETYGRLYNWYAVNDGRNIAPEGWHVPTDDEWKQLEMCLGMSETNAGSTGWRGTDEGGKLKEAGTIYWYQPNIGATNESGFTALPSGFRLDSGSFYLMGMETIFWSSTESSYSDAWYRYLIYSMSQIAREGFSQKGGFSVRCVKD